MARRKNVKRIDPRYFLNETVNRNDDGSVFEEGKREEIQALIDAGMISPEEAKNMLAGRRADQAAPSAPIPGLSDLGPDEVDVDPLQEGPSIPAAEYAGESGIPPRRAHRAKTWVELRLKELGDLDAVLASAEEDPSIGEHMMFAIQTEVEKLAAPASGVSQQE